MRRAAGVLPPRDRHRPSVEEIFFGQFPARMVHPRLDRSKDVRCVASRPGWSSRIPKWRTRSPRRGRLDRPRHRKGSPVRNMAAALARGSVGRRSRTTGPGLANIESSPTSRPVGFEADPRGARPGAATSSTARTSTSPTGASRASIPTCCAATCTPTGSKNASQVGRRPRRPCSRMRRDLDADERADIYAAVEQPNAEHVTIVPLYSPFTESQPSARVSGLHLQSVGTHCSAWPRLTRRPPAPETGGSTVTTQECASG